MVLSHVIARLTFRQALARRRWIIVVLLGALPIIMALLTRIYGNTGGEPIDMVANGLSPLILTVVVPILSLILANAVLGAEVHDGTVTYLLTKPIPRWHIVLNKLAIVSAIGMLVTMSATLASGAMVLGELDPKHVVVGIAAGAALGSFLYAALFLALCLITRRGMLIGLVYLVVWEGAFSGIFSGTRVLSVRQYMLSLADEIAHVVPTDPPAHPLPGTAHIMSAIVAVVAIGLCIQRLRTFEVGKSV